MILDNNKLLIIESNAKKFRNKFNIEDIEDAKQELVLYLLKTNKQINNDTEFSKYVYSSLKRDLTGFNGLTSKNRKQRFKEVELDYSI